MWDAFLTVCTVVGMLTIYAVVLGALLLWAIRTVQRRTARSQGRIAPGAPAGVERRARSWDELPEWVQQDREWAAAIVILGSPTLAERTVDHIDFGARTVDWAGLRSAAETWPDEERRLVELADELAHPTPTLSDRAVVGILGAGAKRPSPS